MYSKKGQSPQLFFLNFSSPTQKLFSFFRFFFFGKHFIGLAPSPLCIHFQASAAAIDPSSVILFYLCVCRRQKIRFSYSAIIINVMMVII